MSAPMPRRGFLRHLVALPLIGGGVTLIGQPSAVAEPVTRGLLAQYWNWLFYERRLLCIEMAKGNEEMRRWLEHTHGGPVGALALCGASVGTSEEIGWISSGSTIAPYDGRRDRYPEFHFPDGKQWTDVPKPSTRAALVMSASGFDWRPRAGR